MLADSWHSLMGENVKNPWTKFWPIKEHVLKRTIMNENEQIINLCASIWFCKLLCSFAHCKEWMVGEKDLIELNDGKIVNIAKVLMANDADTRSTTAKAYHPVETFMLWFECTRMKLILLNRLKDLIPNKWYSKCIQLKISLFSIKWKLVLPYVPTQNIQIHFMLFWRFYCSFYFLCRPIVWNV